MSNLGDLNSFSFYNFTCFFQNMKGTMNALIMKMKMGEHEHDEAVNVDELKW